MDVKVKQRLAAEYLSNGGSVIEAAEKAGVNARTIYKWLDKEDFKQLVAEKKEAYMASVSAEILPSWNTLRTKAYDTLLEMLQPDKPDSVRLKAALAVIQRDDEQAKSSDSDVTVVFGNVPVLGEPSAEVVTGGSDTN